MNQITTSAELKAAILELEKKKEIQKLTIKGQAHQAKQALNPVHFIKNTFSRVAETPEIKKILIGSIIGIGLGYIFKKVTTALQEEKLDNMVNKLVGHGMDKVVERNPNSLLSKAVSLTRQLAKEKLKDS